MLSENEKGGKKRSAHCVDNSQFNSSPPKKKNLSLDPSLSPVLQVKAIFNMNIVIVWCEHKKEKKIALL